MPNLSIKSVPEALAESLRQRAARNHRSLQGELMAILEAAVSEQPPLVAQAANPAIDWRTRLEALRPPGVSRGVQSAEQLVAAMRVAHPIPRKSPSSTEIIRQMRDEHYGEAWVAAGIKDGPWPPDQTEDPRPGQT